MRGVCWAASGRANSAIPEHSRTASLTCKYLDVMECIGWDACEKAVCCVSMLNYLKCNTKPGNFAGSGKPA